MAVGADTIIGLGAYAPPALHATAARLMAQARWCNLVVSNIPAPQVPLYFAGAPLEASYPAMNLKEDCGLSIACTSAAGTMAFGLTADWDLVPDIDVLALGSRSPRRTSGRGRGHLVVRVREPVGDLGEPPTGGLHLRDVSEIVEESSSPCGVACQLGLRERRRDEAVPAAMDAAGPDTTRVPTHGATREGGAPAGASSGPRR